MRNIFFCFILLFCSILFYFVLFFLIFFFVLICYIYLFYYYYYYYYFYFYFFCFVLFCFAQTRMQLERTVSGIISLVEFNQRVGINCSKFDCSTINWSTLLAGNQLLDTKFINCSNPVNPGSTGFEQLTLLSSATHKLKKSIFYL